MGETPLFHDLFLLCCFMLSDIFRLCSSDNWVPNLLSDIFWRVSCEMFLLLWSILISMHKDYFRHTILPRLRSYGLTSTTTSSAGKMRMWFWRSLPDKVHRTSWSPSTRILNKVPGRASTTTPLSSILSWRGSSTVDPDCELILFLFFAISFFFLFFIP